MNIFVNSARRSRMAARKRVRRTPEKARSLILDAAQASLASRGPAGIRLQDVARAAGVSHSNVLHHFGSRAGLIEALNRRTLDDLKVCAVRGHGGREFLRRRYSSARHSRPIVTASRKERSGCCKHLLGVAGRLCRRLRKSSRRSMSDGSRQLLRASLSTGIRLAQSCISRPLLLSVTR